MVKRGPSISFCVSAQKCIIYWRCLDLYIYILTSTYDMCLKNFRRALCCNCVRVLRGSSFTTSRTNLDKMSFNIHVNFDLWWLNIIGHLLCYNLSILIKVKCFINHSYTPRTLRSWWSQSEFRILKIRERRVRALFLYNCTLNTVSVA